MKNHLINYNGLLKILQSLEYSWYDFQLALKCNRDWQGFKYRPLLKLGSRD